MPRAKASCTPFTKSNKKKKSAKIRRATSSNPCLRVDRRLLKSVFTVFDFHKMDVPLFWEELTRVTDLGSGWSGCGSR
eukprot:1142424-Pelagomonas_calceolata.AAC.6